MPIWTPAAPSANAAAIPRASVMPPARDHRNRDRIDDLRDQRAGADLQAEIVAQEHSAMTARLEALGDDRIATACRDLPRFRNGRGGAQDDHPGLLQPGNERRLGQAKVKAHHRRLELEHERAQLGIERDAMARRHGCRRVDGELAIVRGEALAPGGFARIVQNWGGVAEEVEVERLRRDGAQPFHLLTNLLGTQHGARQRAEPARLRHGCGQLESIAPAIGACTIGMSSPIRSRRRRSGHGIRAAPQPGSMPRFL